MKQKIAEFMVATYIYTLQTKTVFFSFVYLVLKLMSKLELNRESTQMITAPNKSHLFVQDVVDFSSQYGKENSSSYTVANIRQRYHYYPKYGDFLGI